MLLKNENLTIRNADAADAEQLAAWWNDGSVMAHAGFPLGLGTSAEKIAAGSEPDINAGATKSSNGINNGIKRAVELYNKLHGEGVI